MDVLGKIDSIIGIKTRITQLQEEERVLTLPLCKDFGLINGMYQVFCDCLKELDPSLDSRVAMQRCKFSLLMVLLYNPSLLAGGRMMNGLRDCIAEATGCKQTVISHDIKSALAYVKYYRAFRDEVGFLYNRLCAKVGECE